jgi:hypothetical protein
MFHPFISASVVVLMATAPIHLEFRSGGYQVYQALGGCQAFYGGGVASRKAERVES